MHVIRPGFFGRPVRWQPRALSEMQANVAERNNFLFLYKSKRRSVAQGHHQKRNNFPSKRETAYEGEQAPHKTRNAVTALTTPPRPGAWELEDVVGGEIRDWLGIDSFSHVDEGI